MKPITITNIVDVVKFFQFLYDRYDLAFHPDDTFDQYVDNLGNQLFTDEEVSLLDDVMERCFVVCEQSGFDLYEVGCEVQLREFQRRGIIPQNF